MTRITLDLADDVNSRLTEIAKKEGISKAEAMRKAFALYSVAIDEQDKGHFMSIAKDNPETKKPEVICKVVGL